MDNEPVAYVTGVRQFDPVMVDITLKVGTPLYTHPAKTLTDEEIKALWKPMPDTKTYDSDILKFAKAILRKAQENEQ